MELLQQLLPSPSKLKLQSWNLDSDNYQVTLSLASTQAVAHCPLCNCPTHRIHSRYERTLKDLPLVQFSLTIFLQVCKFFCLNQHCHRRIFTERLPDIVAPWARRTVRYTNHLKAMGLALGGSAAVRLSHQIGYGCSRNSILHLVSSLPMPTITTSPRILGVDDFAFRKGHRYGTILVDLEQHKPIALLPDRTAETLAAWLKEHPGVEILSRDRSKTYRRGMTDGAPDVIQVADRFHLLQNLEEVLERVFKGKSKALKEVDKAQLQAEGITVQPLVDPPCDLQSPKAQNRARRLEKYEQTHALRQQGYRIKDIAHHLGIGKRTVYTYLAAPTFPEYAIPQRSSGLDVYKPYLLEQWQQGRQNTKELFQEIQAHGYEGSYATVARYTHQLRQSQAGPNPDPESLNHLPGRGPAPKVRANHKPLSARRAAWLVLQ